MTKVYRNEVEYNHHFDPGTKRHRINGIQSVVHCHHYTTLYTQLAIDSGETMLLADCARESFRETLCNYLAEHSDIDTLSAKIDICCQYYALLGLGKMRVNFLGDESGEVELLRSHTDAGWKKKWGTYDRPVNYVTAGFIEALFEAVLDAAPKTFVATEKQSIVMGAETSVFAVVRR